MPSKLLLHVCCAPCSTAVIDVLQQQYDITLFFSNANIYPYDEYEKRLAQFAQFTTVPLILDEYTPQLWQQAIAGLETAPEKGARCTQCYAFRLARTAQYAVAHNFEHFATTLSVSPYKNIPEIITQGNQIAQQYQVPFLAEDFTHLYKRSIELSKVAGLYRQKYCGCVYSLRS